MKRPRAIIKIGGGLLTDGASLARFADDLSRVARAGAWRVAIVHGGGVLIDARLASTGRTTKRVNGMRITPTQVMEDVVSVLRGQASMRLCAALKEAGCAPVGLSLSDGGTVALMRSELEGVGDPKRGDEAFVETLWNCSLTPVFACCGMDEDGAWLNVNADDASGALARTLDADRLLLLSDVEGVLDAQGRSRGEIDKDGAEAMIRSGEIRNGMATKVRAALRAGLSAGCDVRIASWACPGGVGALLGDGDAGTRIRRQPEACVRA